MRATGIAFAGTLMLAAALLAGCNDEAAPVAKDTSHAEQVVAEPAAAGGAVAVNNSAECACGVRTCGVRAGAKCAAAAPDQSGTAHRNPYHRGRRERTHRCVLRRARPLRQLGAAPGLFLCLAAGTARPRLASLSGRPMVVVRGARLVLGILGALRLGGLSLRALGLRCRPRLVLGSRRYLGAGLGDLAPRWRADRLGPDPA